jgi:hypothetical protein
MMTETEIQREIEAKESEREKLSKDHAAMVQSFNQACAQNQATWNHLTGRIEALKAILNPPEPAPPPPDGD